MSTFEVNPNDYQGANVFVVGRAGGPVTNRKFPGGGEVAELSIAVTNGYKKDGEFVVTGTDWYRAQAAPDYAAQNWPEIGKGDVVRIDNGRLEARPYLSKDGEPKVDLQIRYGDVSLIKAADAESGKPF